ncbi:cell division protein CrgA [Brachybacterium sp. GCM10030268]|uniref:cell division protein CrgA n=1 Tax=Brachybacterium sp. GCM10030268 TaxID=3273382 RepID=UPI00361037EA
MARSRKKSSARATSKAKAGDTPVAPGSDDLDELGSDGSGTDAAEADGTATSDAADGDSAAGSGADHAGTDADADAGDASEATASESASGKDPVKRSRAAGAKDPVATKDKRSGGKSTSAGSEATEKAKDATRTPSAKKAAAAETARTTRRRVAAEAPNPPWLAPAAVVFLILGLLYLVTYYLSSGQLPLPIGDWNLAAGFGVMLVGGGMLMFWK